MEVLVSERAASMTTTKLTVNFDGAAGGERWCACREPDAMAAGGMSRNRVGTRKREVSRRKTLDVTSATSPLLITLPQRLALLRCAPLCPSPSMCGICTALHPLHNARRFPPAQHAGATANIAVALVGAIPPAMAHGSAS